MSKQAWQSVPQDDVELVSRFESLGDNCEFGMMQRYVGAEPISLLRFNFTHIRSLLRGLESRFSDLAMPGQVTTTWTDEWMIREESYKFYYHTHNRDPDYPVAKLISDQSKWLKYMANMLVESLSLGHRIFVRKGGSVEQEPEIHKLAELIGSYGPNTLLWVTQADELHPPGSVERINETLVRGWIKRFATYERAQYFDPVDWVLLVRRVWSFLSDQELEYVRNTLKPNYLPRNFGGWNGCAAATAQFSWDIQPPAEGLQVMKHTVMQDTPPFTSLYGCRVGAEMFSEGTYVASAYIFIPQNFSGTLDLAFHGRPSFVNSKFDLIERGRWELLWVSAELKDLGFPVGVDINGECRAGDVFYSAGWRLSRGTIPA